MAIASTDAVMVAVLAMALGASIYVWSKGVRRGAWQRAREEAQSSSSGSGAEDDRRGERERRLPPGRMGLPWVGESLSLLAAMREGDHDRFLRERTASFGSHTFKTVIFNQKTVVLQGVDANRFIAASENKGLLRNSWPPSMLAVVGGGAPIALHGAEHRRLRQVLLSCLCPAALHKLVHRTHTLTLRHFATTTWPRDMQRHQPRLELVPLLNLHNFRLACSLLASITDEQLISRLHTHFRAWLAGMLDLPLDFPGTNYRRARSAGDELRREMGKIIEQRSAAQDPSMTNQLGQEEDVLATLLRTQDETGQFLSRTEMQDVLLFLLFAGHDTTTSALTFALKYLEQNPLCLERVVEEQEDIARRRNAAEERLNWEHVQSMRYTWQVLQETMRLRPPVTASMKEATQDLEFEGYHIPKGWKVYFGLGRTHSDEKIFPHASRFDPSRFDPDCKGRAGPPPFTYVPFGVGPHSCLGHEFARLTMCVYLHVLVRHFRWVSLNPREKVIIRTFPTPTEGYPASVTMQTPFDSESDNY